MAVPPEVGAFQRIVTVDPETDDRSPVGVPGALADVQRIPAILRRADRRRPIDLGQAVDMRQLNAGQLTALDNRRRWRSAGNLPLHDMLDTQIGRAHV